MTPQAVTALRGWWNMSLNALSKACPPVGYRSNCTLAMPSVAAWTRPTDATGVYWSCSPKWNRTGT